MATHVISSAVNACYLLREDGIEATTALVTPSGDPVKHLSERVEIIEGPEHDVLTRYAYAMNIFSPDYLVRLTGDCPFLTDEIIAKHVRCAVEKELDYCTNALDFIRTYPDGYDVEVISKRLFDWCFETATTAHDREHVTTLIRSARPDWARVGVVLGFMDISDLKVSIDTEKEFDEGVKRYKALGQKLEYAHLNKFEIFRF